MSDFTQFKARIGIRGINPYVLVSAERATLIKSGWRKPLPVILQINDRSEELWHINMMPVGDGSFYLYLHGDIRRKCSVEVGDLISVKLCFDADYRGGPSDDMPTDFAEALNRSSSALINWEALSPSKQKEVIRYLTQLKTQVALQRNIKQAIYVLEGNSARFLARDWVEGR